MPEIWKYIAGSIFIGTTTYGLIKYFAGGVCRCTKRLDGRVVVITGGNSGIGKALAVELAKRGAHLIIACRDLKRGEEAKIDILKLSNSPPNTKIYIKYLDLCSFQAINKFVENIKQEFQELYALVNCAGVFYHPQGLTRDGFEITFQTNYLGPFVLTNHLLPLLACHKDSHARIINVTSEAHRRVSINDLKVVTKDQNQIQSHFVIYGVTKLALLLFTRYLAKNLFFEGTDVLVNAVNPGNVETAIFRNYPPLANRWLYALQKPIRLLVVKTPQQGCQTVLHTLLTNDRATGQYYSDCKINLASPIAINDKIAKEYYHTTLSLLANLKLQSTFNKS